MSTYLLCVYVCSQEMSVGYANGIRVMSMTHTGEPGFMLYIPIEVNLFWLNAFAHTTNMFPVHQSDPAYYINVSLRSPQYALHVYNEVMSVGQKYGIRNAGYYALRSLRIEKFFAFWGQDLDSFTTPLECGREFRVKFDKVRLALFLHQTEWIHVDSVVWIKKPAATKLTLK